MCTKKKTSENTCCPLREPNGKCMCMHVPCCMIEEPVCDMLRDAYQAGADSARRALSHVKLLSYDELISKGTSIHKVAIYDDRRVSEGDAKKFIEVADMSYNPNIIIVKKEQWKNVFQAPDDANNK